MSADRLSGHGSLATCPWIHCRNASREPCWLCPKLAHWRWPGWAMIVHGFVTRPTRDIDLFTEIDDHEARQVVAVLRRALEEQDLITHDSERSPLDHRFVAVDPTTGAECTVEVFADGG